MRMTKSKLIFTLIFFISIPLIFGVNICPLEKNPTEITIEHFRNPINIPAGVTENSIDFVVQLDMIDRKTQNRIPLANKNITIELAIGGKFITKDVNGNFVVRDEASPFVITTDENGKASFTVYTQPPLLEESVDPRKISYSITAVYTPKPREPLMGSTKTESYTPTIFPIISLAVCAPLFLIFALLIAAMFAAGKNPFGIFDFSRVAFRANLPSSRVTTRQRTTLTGVAATAAYPALKTAVSTGVYKIGRLLTPTYEKEQNAKGVFKVVQTVASIPGKILMTSVSRKLSKEEIERLRRQQAIKGKVLTVKEMEEVLGPNKRIVKGLFGETRIVTVQERISFSSLLSIFMQTFYASLGRLGVRPWSLSYASIPEVKSASNEVYTKEEKKEILEKVKAVLGIQLDEKDIDAYGINEKGKIKILERIDKEKITEILELQKMIEEYKKNKSLKEEDVQKIFEYIQRRIATIDFQLNSPYITERQKKLLSNEKEKLSVTNVNKLISNLENILEGERQNLLNRIGNNGSLIGFDKEHLIVAGKINAPQYYINYGIDEFKAKMKDAGILAELYGIDIKRLAQAYESGDPNKINSTLKEIFQSVKEDPNKLTAFNYIIKDIQIGTIHRFLNKMEFRDEKGVEITNPYEKIVAFSNTDYGLQENKERITKSVVYTLDAENKLNTKGIEKAVKIVYGEKTSVTPENVLSTVLKGEEIINDKIKNLQKELEELKIKYRNPSVGMPGYEEIKRKEEQIENAKFELSIVRKETEFIKSERDNLILMKEIYDRAKYMSPPNDMSLPSVSSATPDSIMIIRKALEASEIKYAEETTNGIISTKRNTVYRIDEMVKALNQINVNPDLSNLNLKQPENNEETYRYVGQIDELVKRIEKEISKQYVVSSVEEKDQSDKERLVRASKINEDIIKEKEKLKEEIDKHIKSNMENPLAPIVDKIEHKEFTDKGIKADVIEKNLSEAKIFGSKTITYIYSNDMKYEKEMNEEKQKWIDAFYGGIRKEGVFEIKVEKGQASEK